MPADKNVAKHSDKIIIITVAGAFCIFVTMGIRHGFGLFQLPFTQGGNDGLVSPQAFAIAIAVQNILWGLMSPVFGALADKRGAVLSIALGALFYTAGMLLMATATGDAVFILAQFFVGLGLAGAGFSVVLGTVGKVSSDAKRTLNLAIVTAAGSVGQFVLVPITQWLIGGYDFRVALFSLAAVAFAMLFFAPYLKIPAQPTAAATNPNPVSLRAVLSCAFTSKSYICLFLGFFVCGFQLVFIITYFPAYISQFGITAQTASIALGMIGLFNIAGSLYCGWAGTRFSKKKALAIFYLSRSLVILLLLLLPKNAFFILFFGAAIGFLWLGTVPLTSGLVATLFGTKHMSMLYGVVFLSHQLGSAAGALLGVYSFKATGDYILGWWVCIALGVIAAALHLPITEKLDEKYRLQFT